ncbi:hypothetical protein Q3G72_031262 [Acer saccharum]|nr:hypothetical protein Q3G72_031262 [Acer saccharum]
MTATTSDDIEVPLIHHHNHPDASSSSVDGGEENSPIEQIYNISAIVDSNFHFDHEAYEREGPLYISTFFAMSYGVGFACLAATVVHVLLFHGREIWNLSKSAFQDKKIDVHTKLMRRYKQVPEWWFICILIVNIATTIFICQYYKNQLQLPGWAILLACSLALFFTLPVGVITATTNQTPALNVITEYIIGFLLDQCSQRRLSGL